MSDNNKTPNFLYIGAEQKEIVKRIDESKFLDLHYGSGGNNVNTARIDLFLFAMALGMETVPSELKKRDTFIRDEYIKTKHEAFLYSAFIYNLDNKDDIDLITNKDKVYEVAQNYANTGFDLIDDMMKTKSETVAELEIIKELDQQYIEYFGI